MLPTAKAAAKAYKAFGEALAADQRARRAALERQAGKLSAFYKAGARPSDCRAGDAVHDYGSAPRRVAGTMRAELSLVRQLRLGSPGTAARSLYLRMPGFDNTVSADPEMVELTPIPTDGAAGEKLAGYAVSGIFQYPPEALATIKQRGITDAQRAAMQKEAADDTFTNFTSRYAMGSLDGTGPKTQRWWRCPSGK